MVGLINRPEYGFVGIQYCSYSKTVLAFVGIQNYGLVGLIGPNRVLPA